MNEKTYKIKGLVWEFISRNKFEVHLSNCGHYVISKGRSFTWKRKSDGKGGVGNSLEDCKAKAEADWLERILPALEEVKEGAQDELH